MFEYGVPGLLVLLTLLMFILGDEDGKRPNISTAQYCKGLLAYLGGFFLLREEGWKTVVSQCEHRDGQDWMIREIDCTGAVLSVMWNSLEKAPFAYIVIVMIERVFKSKEEVTTTEKMEKAEAAEEVPERAASDVKG